MLHEKFSVGFSGKLCTTNTTVNTQNSFLQLVELAMFLGLKRTRGSGTLRYGSCFFPDRFRWTLSSVTAAVVIIRIVTPRFKLRTRFTVHSSKHAGETS